jgi:hypothetical protein
MLDAHRYQAPDKPDLPEYAEAAAQMLEQAARRIRRRESVQDVCRDIRLPVVALCGRT